jgi:surface polysaccharide O-acyltransferase-like enzyme
MARLRYVDSARGAAVVLAMLSHSLIQFAPEFDGLKLLTRTATPAFLVLFGTMIEVAYLRKIRGGSPQRAVSERLLSRMVTCYLLYVAVTAAAVLTGKIGLHAFTESILFLDEDRFGTILRTYAALFFIVVLVLPWAVRFGSTVFLGIAAVGWVLKYALAGVGGGASYPMNVVFGNGEGFGPAVLTSFTFVGFGLAIGEALTGRRGFWRSAVIAALAVAVLVVDVQGKGLDGYGALLRDYRWQNHPAYFAFGVLSTAAILLVFRVLWMRRSADRFSAALATFGQQTLFVYGLGNVALNLLPVYGGRMAVGLVLTAGFMAALLWLSLDRARPRPLANRLLLGVPGAFVRTYGWLLDRLVGVLALALAWQPAGSRPVRRGG